MVLAVGPHLDCKSLHPYMEKKEKKEKQASIVEKRGSQLGPLNCPRGLIALSRPYNGNMSRYAFDDKWLLLGA